VPEAEPKGNIPQHKPRVGRLPTNFEQIQVNYLGKDQ
jgi:hypothetical protein